MKPAGQAEFAPTAQRRRYDVTPAKKYAAQHALETPNPQVASQGVSSPQQRFGDKLSTEISQAAPKKLDFGS